MGLAGLGPLGTAGEVRRGSISSATKADLLAAPYSWGPLAAAGPLTATARDAVLTPLANPDRRRGSPAVLVATGRADEVGREGA